ncbi:MULTISPECIES: galactose ABC transporter substrate-binding protein [Clostridium]|uniref:D-galactose/methyl-galactoside binding periplasmic protein MglB n=1 Tax=Clostridium cibarium TaxID=2762247 RepID=A0ABR8PW27_9CLOT|nr:MULTISPECIES: galactose ABC transporter substrate-binding protein [Clostridium]MBD7912344.1 galactose ABC transporter substrate-binding protein [Clostridium cibarium]
MKTFKKFLSILIIALLSFSFAFPNKAMAQINPFNPFREVPIKIAVVMYDVNEPYPSQIVKYLQVIQEENKDKVQFTFFNSNNNENLETQFINSIISNEQYNLILLDLVNINSVENVINRIKSSNIPVIVFHSEPYNMDAIKSYNKAIFIGSSPEEGGILQGEILINEWIKHKNTVDHNKNNVMEYILLKGKPNSLDTIGRSKASVSTIDAAGIKTKELSSVICNWDKEEGRKATEALLLQFGDKIEVINSNNDSMAIGAIEALQSYGFNKEGSSRTIPVVGVDGLPEAIELIDKGIMTNTVIQDAKGTAEALFYCGMNLAENKKPLEGTNYTFDDSGVAIRIPYMLYKALN